MNRAERVAMIDRGRADLSVRRQCAVLGLALRGLSPAGGAGCRRIDADAVDRRAGSGDTVLRLTSTAHGGCALGGPSGQPQASATADAADGARSVGPKAEDQATSGGDTAWAGRRSAD